MEKLKDIHLPATEAWWHLAWGWWALLAVLLLLCVLIYYSFPTVSQRYQKYKARQSLLGDVQHELAMLRSAAAESSDSLALLAAISTLLRRVAVTVFEPQHSASLIGYAWLNFLDEQWGESKPDRCFLDADIAELLNFSAYHGKIDDKLQLSMPILLDLTEKWAMKVLKNYG